MNFQVFFQTEAAYCTSTLNVFTGREKTKQNMMKTLFLKRNLYLGSKSFTVLVLCGFARVAQCAGITEIGNDE